MVQGWIRANLVWGLWLGTPCSSFSRARRAPPESKFPSALRSADHPRGLSNLGAKDHAKLVEGNSLADRAGLLQRAAHARGLPGGEENPANSFLWCLPSRTRFLQQRAVHDTVIDYCAFGTPFRARTRLRTWGPPPPPALLKARCTGRGTCSCTGCPHEQLSGRAPGAHSFQTGRKNSYPRRLCSILARHLVAARRAKQASNMWAVFSGK